MKFIIGIGNPEKKYEGTRHNVGFAAVDRIAAKVLWKKDKVLNSWAARTDADIFLVKPETFVNRTGQAASLIVEKHGAGPGDILVLSDDVNLDFGKLRLREKGSAGGHHGLESIIEALGGDDFPRLRIGVRNARMPKEDLAPFVLQKFTAGEAKDLKDILNKVALVCESWANEGFKAAMNVLSRLQSVKKIKGVKE